MPPRPPDYAGGSLVNLVAELERRLTGSAPSPGLHPHLAGPIPDARSYVLVLFDGLGDRQLGHPQASPLRASRVGAIDAPFPTTTTVSMATVATGLPPSQHGLLGYALYLPDVGDDGAVVNTIKWTTPWGEAVEYDYDAFLPAPNLWERLRIAGAEPITVQPFNFERSPLSRVLYRGCRFETWANEIDAADAVASMAAEPNRLVFLYLPHVDFAAHVAGQEDPNYSTALEIVSRSWERLSRLLPDGAVAVGTADHGHVDIAPQRRAQLADEDHDGLRLFGDARALFVNGDGAALAEQLPATWVPIDEMQTWWGPGPSHPAFDDRAPDGVLLADPGRSLLPRYADKRLIGQHGGLTDEERRIPLLVAGG